MLANKVMRSAAELAARLAAADPTAEALAPIVGSPAFLALCEAAVGEPARAWASRCHEIAVRINRKLGLRWEERYGHYYGPVAPASPFAGWPVVRHGWLAPAPGVVVDPTRWVFECADPYVHAGPDAEYDFGGVRLKRLTRCPCPAFDPAKRCLAIAWPPATAEAVDALVGVQGVYGVDQLVWVASLPPADVGSPEAVRGLYETLRANGLKAFVPIDFWTAVMAGGRY